MDPSSTDPINVIRGGEANDVTQLHNENPQRREPGHAAAPPLGSCLEGERSSAVLVMDRGGCRALGRPRGAAAARVAGAAAATVAMAVPWALAVGVEEAVAMVRRSNDSYSCRAFGWSFLSQVGASLALLFSAGAILHGVALWPTNPAIGCYVSSPCAKRPPNQGTSHACHLKSVGVRGRGAPVL